MKNRTITFITAIVLLFCSWSLYAQITFEKWYGGTNTDIGNAVAQTSDGGYIIAGSSASFGAGNDDVYLIKTDASGDTLWTKTYGGFDWDHGYSVVQTSDDGYVITGWTMSYSLNEDVYLIKTNASGDTLWTRTYGGVEGDGSSSVQQTTDGGYIIAGGTSSYGAGYSDVYLIKTNSSGDTLWTKTYGGADQDWGNSVAQTADGGYIITGLTASYGAGGEDFYLVKTNASGDTLWTKTYGGTVYDEGNSVAQTTDGGYIIAGQTNSYGAGLDVYLIKTGASGDTLWTKTYGGADIEGGYSVSQTADSGYIVAGATTSYGAGGYDVYLIKTDANGNVGVEEKENSDFEFRISKLRVYPNPFTDKVEISWTLGTGHSVSGKNPITNDQCPMTIFIYDTSGRLVKSVPLTSNHFSLGTDLVPGIYFLKLNGKSIGKVIKVR